MKVASLFSGCGGLDLGLEEAGHQIILQCESDPGCQQVLKHWFPGTLLSPDVCALERLPKDTELLAAGFPCIDISRAGLRRGVEGESTGLVRHVFRLLAEAKREGRAVPWVLLENVEALLDRVGGGTPAIQYITDALEQLGYSSWAHRVLCTAGWGVPNRRKRLFVVASMHGDARDVLLSQGLQKCPGSCCPPADSNPNSNVGGPRPRCCYECYDAPALEGSVQDLDKCSLAFDLGNARCPPGVDVCPTFTTSNSRICLALEKEVGILRTSDAERLQGFPPGWTETCWPVGGPGIATHRKPTREHDSDSRERARHALLGNAVSVPVGRWLGERLMDPYHRKYFGYNEVVMPRELQSKVEPMSTERWEEFSELQGLTSKGLLVTGLRASDPDNLFDSQEYLDSLEEGKQGTDGGNGAVAAGENGANGAVAENGVAAEQPAANGASGSSAAEANGHAGSSQDAAAAADKDGSKEDADACVAAPATPASALASTAGKSGSTPSEPANAAKARARAGEPVSYKQAQKPLPSSQNRRSGAASVLWPSCAFFVRRLGRHGLHGVSDCPVKIPYSPLAGFIPEAGKPPSLTALYTYMMRLKEQGWNIEPTVRKLLRAGTSLPEDTRRIVRSIAETGINRKRGELVWAKDCKLSSWWPAEALDPFNLPQGVILSPKQISALNQRDKGLYLPTKDLETNAKLLGERRKVLVIFFGDQTFNWQFRETLLPYEEHKEAKKAELETLFHARALTCTAHYNKAFQDLAVAQSMIESEQDKEAARAENADPVAICHPSIQKQAVEAAAKAANMERCGACEVCLTSQVLRRCFVVRAFSAAAAGHAGAQLAVLGRGCIGASISCWWPLDEAWYNGKVVDYDRFQVRHTIVYEDNDQEVIPLWAPNQLVRIHNTPSEWPVEAERIRRAEEAKVKLNTAKAAQHKAKVEEEQERRARMMEEAIQANKTPYERERDERMAANKAQMLAILAGEEGQPAAPVVESAAAGAAPSENAAATTQNCAGTSNGPAHVTINSPVPVAKDAHPVNDSPVLNTPAAAPPAAKSASPKIDGTATIKEGSLIALASALKAGAAVSWGTPSAGKAGNNNKRKGVQQEEHDKCAAGATGTGTEAAAAAAAETVTAAEGAKANSKKRRRQGRKE